MGQSYSRKLCKKNCESKMFGETDVAVKYNAISLTSTLRTELLLVQTSLMERVLHLSRSLLYWGQHLGHLFFAKQQALRMAMSVAKPVQSGLAD